MDILERCPVCLNAHGGRDEFISIRSEAGFRIQCGVCGRFEVSEEAVEDFLERSDSQSPTDVQRAALSHWIRRQEQGGANPLLLLSKNVVDAREGRISLPPVSKRTRLVLRFIESYMSTTGRRLPRLPESFSAYVGAPTPEEAALFVRELIRDGLVEGIDTSSFDGFQFSELALTRAGHAAMEELERSPSVPVSPPPAPVVERVSDADANPSHPFTSIVLAQPDAIRLELAARALLSAALLMVQGKRGFSGEHLCCLLRYVAAAEACALHPSVASRGYFEAAQSNLRAVQRAAFRSPVQVLTELVASAAPTIQSFRRGRGAIFRASETLTSRWNRLISRSVVEGHEVFWGSVTDAARRDVAPLGDTSEPVQYLASTPLSAPVEDHVQRAIRQLESLPQPEGWAPWVGMVGARVRGVLLSREMFTAYVRGDASRWPPVISASECNAFLLARLQQLGEERHDAHAADELSPPGRAPATYPAVQVPVAMHFAQLRDGPIDLVASTEGDPQFILLKGSVSAKADSLRRMIEPSSRGYDLSAYLLPHIDAYRQALDLPAVTVVLIWSTGNSLRAALEAHKLAQADSSEIYPGLPPLIGAALGDLVETHNVLMRTHHEGRELDNARLGPRSTAELEAAVRAAPPVVAALENAPEVIAFGASSALHQLVAAGRKALDQRSGEAARVAAVATDSLGNAVVAVVEMAVREIGPADLNQSPNLLERQVVAAEKLADEAEVANRRENAKKDRPALDGLKVAGVGATFGAAGTFVAVNGPSILAFLETMPRLAPLAETIRVICRLFGLPL